MLPAEGQDRLDIARVGRCGSKNPWQGIAMIIVDHHLALALALSDRTVVLERDAVTWTGASASLKHDLDLRR